MSSVQNILKTLVMNSGEPDTGAILEINISTEDGNETRTSTGKTTGPIIAERWLRMLNEEVREG